MPVEYIFNHGFLVGLALGIAIAAFVLVLRKK